MRPVKCRSVGAGGQFRADRQHRDARLCAGHAAFAQFRQRFSEALPQLPLQSSPDCERAQAVFPARTGNPAPGRGTTQSSSGLLALALLRYCWEQIQRHAATGSRGRTFLLLGTSALRNKYLLQSAWSAAKQADRGIAWFSWADCIAVQRARQDYASFPAGPQFADRLLTDRLTSWPVINWPYFNWLVLIWPLFLLATPQSQRRVLSPPQRFSSALRLPPASA
jgi:hypothetical protein